MSFCGSGKYRQLGDRLQLKKVNEPFRNNLYLEYFSFHLLSYVLLLLFFKALLSVLKNTSKYHCIFMKDVSFFMKKDGSFFVA